MANRNRRPKSKSTNQLVNENGIKDQPKRLKNSVKIGATRKLKVFELVGITVSLSRSLRPSARGCNKPNNPTLLGPSLC